MHFKPAHSEPSSLRIREILMVGTDNINEVWIFLHAQVVLNILKDDLNDRIALRNVFCREMTAHYLLQQRFVGICGVVLLSCDKELALSLR